jgi:hypothetical protein
MPEAAAPAVLLDTRAAIWLINGDPMSPHSRAAITNTLLKNSTYSDAEERKESESVASGINHSPLPSFANQSCVTVWSENLS